MHELKAWHVLQAHKDGLKVEFDSIEHWMAALWEECDTLIIDGYSFKVVGLSSLRELRRRGLEAVASQSNELKPAKYLAIAEKYTILCTV